MIKFSLYKNGLGDLVAQIGEGYLHDTDGDHVSTLGHAIKEKASEIEKGLYKAMAVLNKNDIRVLKIKQEGANNEN